MYQGKYGENKPVKKHKRRSRKPIVAIISLIAILVCMVGGTIAYLVDYQTVINTFEPGRVTCSIEEEFSDGVKSAVWVKNTGNTPAYIRVRVVATWQDSEGYIYGGPAPAVTVTPGKGWHADGEYFVTDAPVEPQLLTPNLLASSITSPTAPKGYHLVVDVLADAIQSTGGATWGKDPTKA